MTLEFWFAIWFSGPTSTEHRPLTQKPGLRPEFLLLLEPEALTAPGWGPERLALGLPAQKHRGSLVSGFQPRRHYFPTYPPRIISPTYWCQAVAGGRRGQGPGDVAGLRGSCL